jgi:poly(3-hydroxybutyrate) depolymerase
MLWPMSFMFDLIGRQQDIGNKNWKFILEAHKIDHGLTPVLATANTVVVDLRSVTLRAYGKPLSQQIPTLVHAPFAGHTAMIADYDTGQSLIETLLANGHERVFLTDWKTATSDMKDLEVDNYMADLNVCVDEVGGRANMIGLSQGGWMVTAYAARYPHKVSSLVLAGSPIDFTAGDGQLNHMIETYPFSFYEDLVAAGSGLLLGEFMLGGWKNMHPDQQYWKKYIDLYDNIEDPDYIKKTEKFASWYENPINLPGRWYLQVISQLFRENRLVKGEFVGLGRKLSLGDVTCPVYLLAGRDDDITMPEQVFSAEKYLGTPKRHIKKETVPGGHIGMFMGHEPLKENWPRIARWIACAK